jgi:hypothetical protein
MNHHDGSRHGRDRGSSLLSYVGRRGGHDPEASPDGLSADRLAGLVRQVDATPAGPAMNVEAQDAGPEAAEGATTATESADESAMSASVVTVPATAEEEGPSTAKVGEADAADVGPAVLMLALAQKLHDEYVSEGQNTRERLISEGQTRHDQVVREASARQEELLATGQATHDEVVSAGEAKHDALVAEAEALLADAQQKRAQVLQGLSSERIVLQKEIEALRTFESDHRTHLKSYFEGQLIELEQTVDDETG